LLAGRSYILRTETDQANATVTELTARIDVNSFAHEQADALAMNEIGEVSIATQWPVVFDGFTDNRTTGSFVLIDRVSNATVGAGLIGAPLRAAGNIHLQSLDVDKAARA